jgi:sigma-54 dependent transcriptional regulator, acetoin dehydrogenase operon transcriptional activator AcoR
MQPSGSHARLVHSVIRGTSRNANAPEHVTRSWQRCLDEYGLDPESSGLPAVVSHQELMARKEQSLELVSFADIEMAHLQHQLAGSGHSIILTDRDGVLLSYYGDPSFKHAASRAGLVPGGVWSERHGGTNGMGTCLAERAPLIVHREQHFLARNTGLTCCAAPIFDPAGELVAVLDASGESDRAQRHTLVLVNLSAQAIEKRLFLHRFRDAFVVRFHSRPELLGTSSEGMIAFDPDGVIAAVDRNALFQLGCKQAAHLMSGAPLERVFNLSLPALVGRSRRKAFHPLPIYEVRHGSRFFALAQEPESAQRPTPAAQRASPAREAVTSSALDELDLGDPVMARNIRAAKRVASRAVPTLLVGETGTGKELFARALHAASERAAEPFVAVDCAAMPEAMLQSALAQAQGGTLFLDEIDELPGALQARLLHLLERGEAVVRAGEAPTPVDVRVVAASAGSLEDKIRRGEFREDLFYRLQGLLLTLPRFHERADKRALIRHLFAQEAADAQSVSLSERLVDALCAHRWPGNLRQLRNALRAMIARRSSDRLDLADLPSDYSLGAPAVAAQAAPDDMDSLNALGRAEREALLRELEREHGNISHVARNLGVSRNAVYRKMHRLRIAWPAKEPRH